MLSVVPSLEELTRNPERAAALPASTLKSLLLRLSAVQIALFTALAVAEEQPAATTPPEQDRMLTPEEAAAMLRCSRRWIYRHADSLPFIIRKSRKAMLCSEAGIRRWLDRRKS